MNAPGKPVMQNDTDVALMAAIANERDRDAFTQLFDTHKHAAYSLARHITGNAAAAEEAVQEAMLQVWLSASTFESRGSVRGWILRIVARQSLKVIRAKQKERADIAQASEMRQDAASPPTENSEQQELIVALRGVLDELPALDRQIVAMYFGGGLTQEEIGEALSTPQRTVSFRIAKALEGIRARLAHAGFAAALPMLITEHLNQALCSGESLPSGAGLKILKHVFRARPAPAAKSAGRTVTRGGRWVVAGSGAAALIALWLWHSSAAAPAQILPSANEANARGSQPAAEAQAAKSTAPTEKPPVAAKAPKAPQVAAVNPQDVQAAPPAKATLAEGKDVVWNFTEVEGKDFEVLDGKWKWEMVSVRLGHMLVPEDSFVMVRLPIELPAKPVLIQIHATTPMGFWNLSSFWLNGAKLSPFRVYSKKTQLLVHKNDDFRRTFNIYCVDQHVVSGMMRDGKPLLNRVQEYAAAERTSQFALFFKNLSVEEIRVHLLGAEEIPDFLRNLKAETDQMNEIKNIDENGKEVPASK